LFDGAKLRLSARAANNLLLILLCFLRQVYKNATKSRFRVLLCRKIPRSTIEISSPLSLISPLLFHIIEELLRASHVEVAEVGGVDHLDV
jgi:hypothetical protein